MKPRLSRGGIRKWHEEASADADLSDLIGQPCEPHGRMARWDLPCLLSVKGVFSLPEPAPKAMLVLHFTGRMEDKLGVRERNETHIPWHIGESVFCAPLVPTSIVAQRVFERFSSARYSLHEHDQNQPVLVYNPCTRCHIAEYRSRHLLSTVVPRPSLWQLIFAECLQASLYWFL